MTGVTSNRDYPDDPWADAILLLFNGKISVKKQTLGTGVIAIGRYETVVGR